MKNDAPIVKPRPVKGFKNEQVLYIPCDSPSRCLGAHLNKVSVRHKTMPFGTFYSIKNKTVLYEFMSAPLAVLALENIIASGAKEILILGFCGSLTPRINPFDLTSITHAYSNEGTSRHYFPRKKNFSASQNLRKRSEHQLDGRGISFTRARVVSTDAPYRETRAWVNHKQAKGIDCVDMEASAVFALAEYYNIEAAALMIVSDSLIGNTWKNRFRHSHMDKILARVFLPLIQE